MHMREPRFRLAQSGSEGSKISGGELIPAWTHQPVPCDPGDPHVQAPAQQIHSKPSAPAAQRGKDSRLVSKGSRTSVAGGSVPPSLKNDSTAGEDETAPQSRVPWGKGRWLGWSPLPSLGARTHLQCSVSYLVHRSPHRSCSHVRCGRPAWPVHRSGCPAEPETQRAGTLFTPGQLPHHVSSHHHPTSPSVSRQRPAPAATLQALLRGIREQGPE